MAIVNIKAHFNDQHKQPTQQKGVVLIVALVFLIALTAVASVLMLNTTADMKMSGSSQVKVKATQEAISSIDEVIFTQMEGGINSFTLSQFPITVAVSSDDTTATITTLNTNSLVVDCPHTKLASSTAVFKCNVLRIRANKLYGRSNTSNIQVNAGVAQQLLNIGG